MRNLLSANFLRLRKSKLFWGILLTMSGLGIFCTLSLVRDMKNNNALIASLNNVFPTCSIFIVIALSVFVPIFFGTEYSDGTIHNKVASGLSRTSIYLAGLVTGMTAAALFCGVYLLSVFVVGTPLLPSTWGAGELCLFLLVTLALAGANCAICLLITLNCQRKALSSSACILLACLTLFAGIYLRDTLHRQAGTPIGIWNERLNQFIWLTAAERGLYVDGIKRAAYEFLYRLLPSCQAVLIATDSHTGIPPQLPLYSLTATAVPTAAGIALFRKKDLK